MRVGICPSWKRYSSARRKGADRVRARVLKLSLWRAACSRREFNGRSGLCVCGSTRYRSSFQIPERAHAPVAVQIFRSNIPARAPVSRRRHSHGALARANVFASRGRGARYREARIFFLAARPSQPGLKIGHDSADLSTGKTSRVRERASDKRINNARRQDTKRRSLLCKSNNFPTVRRTSVE